MERSEEPRRWPRGSFLASLNPGDRDALLSMGTSRRFDAGAVLVRSGEPGTDVALLLDGCVKVMADSKEGRPVLLAVRVFGDLIGELAALDENPRSATVIAAVPTRARVMSRQAFLGFVTGRPAVGLTLQRSIVAKLRMATRYRIDVSGAPVVIRVARILDQLADSYGRAESAEVHIDVPLTQPEIAALVGAALPSVERALASLRKGGMISTGYRHYVIRDLGALRRLVS
ncbi:Crp/Fnr family transcriptional regulator [Sphaerimonospora cavernae]|uniref:Crp/Fnr family transcriptional regulator n=1 Tax=Sphaerimonospora cavernae TaxID=1740611 RepID=A0ABV6U5R4_9ACTN